MKARSAGARRSRGASARAAPQLGRVDVHPDRRLGDLARLRDTSPRRPCGTRSAARARADSRPSPVRGRATDRGSRRGMPVASRRASPARRRRRVMSPPGPVGVRSCRSTPRVPGEPADDRRDAPAAPAARSAAGRRSTRTAVPAATPRGGACAGDPMWPRSGAVADQHVARAGTLLLAVGLARAGLSRPGRRIGDRRRLTAASRRRRSRPRRRAARRRCRRTATAPRRCDLAVSTSAIGLVDGDASPTATSQRTSSASVRPSPRSGRRKRLVLIASSHCRSSTASRMRSTPGR